MAVDPITGQTLRFTFIDGPVAGKTFEHTFGADGGVTFREISERAGKPGKAERYEVATVGEDVYAVAYLAESGFTLTTILDYRSNKLVAFASNEKQLVLQHGSFETLAKIPQT
jgi:hypothetical protein